MNQTEDGGKKSEILSAIESLARSFGLVAVPIIVAYFANQYNEQKQDIYLLDEFKKTYYQEETRDLGFNYVKLINNKTTQMNIRNYLMWHITDQNIITKLHENLAFHFESNADNKWLHLYHNFYSMRELDPVSAKEQFDYFKQIAPQRYIRYANKEELDKVFTYIEHGPKR